jgi:hypothetical protein
MANFFLKYNDVLPVLRSYLSDVNGYINLSGQSVTFIYQDRKMLNAPVTGSTTIVSAVSGLVQYDWSSGISPGSYIGEFRAKIGGLQISFPNDSVITFDIEDNIS